MKPQLVIAVASPMTLQAFLIKHLERFAQAFKVTVLFPGQQKDWEDTLLKYPQLHEISFQKLDIHRKPSPFNDLQSLIQLIGLIRKLKPDVMLTVTPKAGLLGALAAWVNRVPVRIHIFTGQVWVTRSGVFRSLLKRIDSLIARLSTHPMADSQTQIDFLVEQGIAPVGRIACIHQGSISGVDLSRFKPSPVARQHCRKRLGIPDDHIVFLFLGRLNRDKGLIELMDAFSRVRQIVHTSHLLIVGPDEEGIEAVASSLAAQNPALKGAISFTGRTSEPENFMAASDIFVLPSYREGFGTVVIEAASCGIPCIASNIYGLSDAVVDSVTGCLVPPRESAPLAEAMLTLAHESDVRTRMGTAALERARACFSQEEVSRFLVSFVAKAMQTVKASRAAK